MIATNEQLNRLIDDIASSNNIEQYSLADITARNKFGNTAMHIAADRGKASVVKWLASKGADVNAINGDGQAPFHIAVYWGELEALKALIKAGADVDGAALESVLNWAAKLEIEQAISEARRR